MEAPSNKSGRIIRSLAGFYEVALDDGRVVTAKPKGLFRQEGFSPVVGDIVELLACSSVSFDGIITRVLERKNKLLRPPVANVDACLIVTAVADPAPNLKFIDLLCVQAEYLLLPIIIFVNKIDLEVDTDELRTHFKHMEYPVIYGSVNENKGIDELRLLLNEKFTAMAGVSGVGKSSLLNVLNGFADDETGAKAAVGDLSQKTKRGKHTTRHCEAHTLGNNTFVCDTPGFSDLRLPKTDQYGLLQCFPDIKKIAPCRFDDCIHLNEPGCLVKKAVEEGALAKSRYRSYIEFIMQ